MCLKSGGRQEYLMSWDLIFKEKDHQFICLELYLREATREKGLTFGLCPKQPQTPILLDTIKVLCIINFQKFLKIQAE